MRNPGREPPHRTQRIELLERIFRPLSLGDIATLGQQLSHRSVGCTNRFDRKLDRRATASRAGDFILILNRLSIGRATARIDQPGSPFLVRLRPPGGFPEPAAAHRVERHTRKLECSPVGEQQAPLEIEQGLKLKGAIEDGAEPLLAGPDLIRRAAPLRNVTMDAEHASRGAPPGALGDPSPIDDPVPLASRVANPILEAQRFRRAAQILVDAAPNAVDIVGMDQRLPPGAVRFRKGIAQSAPHGPARHRAVRQIPLPESVGGGLQRAGDLPPLHLARQSP